MFAPLLKFLHGPVYRQRIQTLTQAIVPYLNRDDRVLDVGCGFGALGRAIMDHAGTPAGVQVKGLERVKRGSEAIEVVQYDGVTMPMDSGSFDVVILADVLHHEPDPDRLLCEAARVAKRYVIVKDHLPAGPFAQQRISIMDWAANTAYGVPCLFRYNTLDQWHETYQRLGFTLASESDRMQLYPWPYSWVFTPRLQYFAVLQPSVDPGAAY